MAQTLEQLDHARERLYAGKIVAAKDLDVSLYEPFREFRGLLRRAKRLYDAVAAVSHLLCDGVGGGFFSEVGKGPPPSLDMECTRVEQRSVHVEQCGTNHHQSSWLVIAIRTPQYARLRGGTRLPVLSADDQAHGSNSRSLSRHSHRRL